MDRPRSIADLPLEVLDLIYKYCGEDITTKAHLAQASQSLGQAFVYHSRNDFRKIPPVPPTLLESWRYILPHCGSNVHEFSTSLDNETDHELKDLVALHCPNLRRLTLRIHIETLDSVISFIDKIKDGLSTVDLTYARDPKIVPKLVQELPEMPLLRILRLQNIHIDDVPHLQKFVNLEKLSLDIYRPFDPKYPPPSTYYPTVNIFSLCAPLTKLRSLRVIGVSIASEDTDVETPLMALEKLKVWYSDIAMDFPTCPKLKSITFIENKIFDSEGSVRRSILKQSESLEKLVFVRRFTPYNNDGFLEVIRTCKKLRYFKLAIRNVRFTHDFVIQIVDALRENGLTPSDPLELVIDEYFKFKWLRHWLTLTSGSELLQPRREYVT